MVSSRAKRWDVRTTANPRAILLIGPGATLQVDLLLQEIAECGVERGTELQGVAHASELGPSRLCQLVTGDGHFTLQPLDDGRRVRFTWSEELTVPWWLGGRVAARVGGRHVMARIWRGNLSRLRRLVERRP